MRFTDSRLRRQINRFGKFAVMTLAISLVALGALLAHGRPTSPQGKFTMQDATANEDDGKRIRAKPGFELVKDENNVTARRRGSSTELSSDKLVCKCGRGNGACLSSIDSTDGSFTCGGGCHCKFVKVER